MLWLRALRNEMGQLGSILATNPARSFLSAAFIGYGGRTLSGKKQVRGLRCLLLRGRGSAMKPSKLLLVVMAIVLSGSVLAVAQSNVNEEKGMKPYDSWHGGDLDSVSMTNGGVVYHIPLVCFPQRGGLELCFTVYANTKQWKSWVNPLNCNNPNDPNGCTPPWIPPPRGD